MFLNTLLNRNPRLVELGFQLHQRGELLPDTYLLDLDTLRENAVLMKREADRFGVELFFMTKQLGRNPAVCRTLMELGYPGAVVVDFREAQVMMAHQIPIAHAGHLVQMPEQFLPALLKYGVGLLTVYSLEKAETVSRLCAGLGITQNIALKLYRKGDFIYPGQEAGMPLEELPGLLTRLRALPNIRVAALTSFPCFLYSEAAGEVRPVSNLDTLQAAQKVAEGLLGYAPALNLPSCTQTSVIRALAAAGGSSGEPGSALMGMTPNNVGGAAAEKPALLYISEISHRFQGHSYCYGGGFYRRGQIDCALVGGSFREAKKIPVEMPSAGNIDYHFTLEAEGEVGDTVAMCFRTQIFVTRSQVAVLSGLQGGQPRLEGIYSSQGQQIAEGRAL